ncbi:hypothetical protein C8F04DRAFT_1190513 [Mycena alexandri]|uniref:Uncharacterized protein n=1 Tax=Mycena alexandri TaxID=1745969 RepID=A0AAD6WVP9_9AGAR|nr:hypothetical protein C8F04DRAFT_1190513 [Mycena alexandri]
MGAKLEMGDENPNAIGAGAINTIVGNPRKECDAGFDHKETDQCLVGHRVCLGAMLARARTRTVNIPAQSEVATFKLQSPSWTWNRGLEHDSTSNFETGSI